VAPRSGDDQVRVRLVGDLDYRGGGPTEHHRAHLDAGLDPLAGEIVRLLADGGLDLVLGGDEGPATLAHDALLDMRDHDPSAVLACQCCGQRDRLSGFL
jgi:hypothetical protein